MSNTDKKGTIHPTSHKPLNITHRCPLFARESIKNSVHEGLVSIYTKKISQQSIDEIMIRCVHLYINYANYKDYE